MAQIKIESSVVIKACLKAMEMVEKGLDENPDRCVDRDIYLDQGRYVEDIMKLAEYTRSKALKNPDSYDKYALIWLDHNDYQLLSEYL